MSLRHLLIQAPVKHAPVPEPLLRNDTNTDPEVVI